MCASSVLLIGAVRADQSQLCVGSKPLDAESCESSVSARALDLAETGAEDFSRERSHRRDSTTVFSPASCRKQGVLMVWSEFP